ncbi:MAG: methylated-DNA--[protein]-cysteine S-methyltransferase [Acidobacteria bacterium]|nr:methylated-DNA--[protein]-cysteine S-methyltransferase [Acidobacteriota bacterium]
MNLWHYELETPLGPMRAAFDGRGRLHELSFGGLDPRDTVPVATKQIREAHAFLSRQLAAYFSCTLRTFTVPLAPEGTLFQMRVWEELRRIPFGQTASYHQLAERLGEPRATRAVGQANGANPIAILIPCHRVIGADGSLVGYGGGMERKEFLLRLEGVLQPVERPHGLFEG